MRRILMSLMLGLGLLAAPATAAVQFSTSGTDANQGNSLSLQVGQTGSMFVWMSTDSGQIIAGVGVDVLSSDPAALEASSYNIGTTNADASQRWVTPVTVGTLGDLVTDSNAFALPGILGTGISTTGQTDFVLFSEVQFTATGEGMTTLTLQANQNAFGDAQGNDLSGQLADVSASVNVTAVPEPGSGALLVLLGGVACWHRRRRS